MEKNFTTFIGENKRESFTEFDQLFNGIEAFMGYLSKCTSDNGRET